MEVKAKLTDARLSAQKARLVADMVRGEGVANALQILEYTNKKGAGLIKKLLESAMANAEENHGADIDELVIGEIFVDDAASLKRISPRAKGRANRIIKRNCHVTIKLLEEEL